MIRYKLFNPASLGYPEEVERILGISEKRSTPFYNYFVILVQVFLFCTESGVFYYDRNAIACFMLFTRCAWLHVLS